MLRTASKISTVDQHVTPRVGEIRPSHKLDDYLPRHGEMKILHNQIGQSFIFILSIIDGDVVQFHHGIQLLGHLNFLWLQPLTGDKSMVHNLRGPPRGPHTSPSILHQNKGQPTVWHRA